MENSWRQPHLMRHNNPAAALLRQVEERIGFGERLRKRLFTEDMGARLQGRMNHRVMLIRPPRRNADKLRFLPLEHRLIIGVLPERLRSLSCLGSTILIGISDRHYFDARVIGKKQIHLMAVISVSGMSDDGGPIARLCSSLREQACRLDQTRGCESRSDFEKTATSNWGSCCSWHNYITVHGLSQMRAHLNPSSKQIFHFSHSHAVLQARPSLFNFGR